MAIESVARQSFGLTKTFTRVSYAISTLLIGLIIFDLSSTGQINSGIGISLLLAYFNGAGPILRVGDTIRTIVEKTSRQIDLFQFIRQFGVQSYPVLAGDKIDANIFKQIQELHKNK